MISYILKYKKHILYLLLIFCILLPRIIFLNSDTVAIPALHNQDEGNYSYNVRNYVVEGSWITDQTNFFFLTPVFSILQLPFVKTLGVHIYSFRLISTSSSVLTMVLGYWILQKKANTNASILFVILLGTNFLYLVHNRIAMPETSQGLFYLLSLYLFYRTITNNKKHLPILTGFLVALTILTKTSATSIVLVMGAFWLYKISFDFIQNKKLNVFRDLKKFILILSGFSVPLTFWHIILLRPNWKLFLVVKEALIDKHRPSITAHLLNKNYLIAEFNELVSGGEANIWAYIPFLLVLVAIFLYKRFKNKNYKPDFYLLSFFWLVIGVLYFGIINYKPARFFVINLIPLSILGAYTLSGMKRINKFLLLSGYLTLNIFLVTTYILWKPNFELQKVSEELESLIGQNTVVGGSLEYMDNDKSRVLNTYFLEGDFNRKEIGKYLEYQEYPKYVLFGSNVADREINSFLRTEKYYKRSEYIINSYFDTPSVYTIYEIKK